MSLIAKAPAPSKKVLNNFPDSDIVAIIDADYCSFSCASVGDEKYIKVTHKKTGKSFEFSKVTDFYGSYGKSKKIGGWLADQNIKREEKGRKPFLVEDFEREECQRRKQEYRISTDEEGNEIKTPVDMEQAKANIFHSAKTVILNDLKNLGTDNYEAYLGKGGRMREDISTLLKYKGNRDNTLKPLLFNEVTEYIGQAFDAQEVNHIETDDQVVIRAYGDPNAVVMGVDKDFYGQPIKFFDVNNPENGVINCDCFGELKEYDSKKTKAVGYGRIFLYWQILAGDSSDNYKANCFSDVKYAGAGAYKDLKDCKDDKEALEKVIEVFKRLYPEPKVVTGWRGNDFLIDWLYVLREQFKMAAMLRFVGDARTIDTEFEKYGVTYEY